jgi:hypothetical protein
MMDDKLYRRSVQLLQTTTQEMFLLPLGDMEAFLTNFIAVSGHERQELSATYGQLAHIHLAIEYLDGVRELGD